MLCKILSNFFGFFMQLLLGVFSFSTLFIKRRVELPKREYKIFLYDISKQVFSGIFAHILNLIFALKLTKIFKNNEDECELYFINFFCDVLFGLPISYLLIQLVNYYAKKNNLVYLISGNYSSTSKPINRDYIGQTVIWVLIVFIYKISVLYILIIPGYKYLNIFGTFILYHLTDNSNTELFLVMVFFPFIFNVVQYWITDHFLKGKGIIRTPYITDLTMDINQNDYDEL